MARMFAALALVLCTQILASHAKSVEYPPFGTFTDQDFFDADVRPFTALPFSPEKLDPLFMLYTRENEKQDDRLSFDDPYYVTNSHFNATRETKVIIHGFFDNKEIAEWMMDMTAEFLVAGDYNVIVVDWRKACQDPYYQAVANGRLVGMMIGKMIETIIEATGASIDSFHVLGHSLGAHVAGDVGKYLKGKLPRITAFDPAGPCYEGLKDHAGRLWHTDAQFVEAIHTDAPHLIPNLGMGMYETCAHVDIFPNGGQGQPGCDQNSISTILIKGLFDGMRRVIVCNHQRAVDFYMEAINNEDENPKAYMCDNYDEYRAGNCADCGEKNERCISLGLNSIDYKTRVQDLSYSQGRRFFMVTDGSEPFLKHQFLVKVSLGPNSDQHGRIVLRITSEQGDTENFDFQSREENLHSSKTYASMFVFNINPTDIKNLEFQWFHNGILGKLFHANIYVEKVEFINLSTDKDTKTPKDIIFENPNPQDGIKNEDKVAFVKKED